MIEMEFWKDKIFWVLTISSILINLIFVRYVHAMWWDSAEYLLASLKTLGQPYNIAPFRFTTYSLFATLFLANENALRIATAIASGFSVGLLYLFVKKRIGRNEAIISAILLMTNWMFIFYSTRILTDSFGLLFIIPSLIFFFDRSKKGNILLGVFTALAILTRREYIIFYIALYSYFLLTIRKRYKELYGVTLGFVVTFLVFLAGFSAVYKESPITYFKSVANTNEGFVHLLYFLALPHMITWIVIIYSIAGIIIYILEKKKLSPELWMLVVFWILIFLFIHFEDRYFIPGLIFLFEFASIAIMKVYDKVKSTAGIAIITALVLIAVWASLSYGIPIIKFKGDSFIEVKEAGEFLKGKGGLIITQSVPQIEYYSRDSNVEKFPKTADEFEKTNWTYTFLSVYERKPSWVYNYDWRKYKLARAIPCAFDPYKSCGFIFVKSI